MLTEEDLAVVRDTLAEIGLQQREYVSNWITAELLYLEAERRGLADSDELRKRVEDAKKRLVINALLEQELYSESASMVTEESIRTAYSSGGIEFALKEDVVN
ncbi:MAG: hypothetical protein HY708_04625, partial [Ignavibacteriae bacterium]|nr:hypothetical protein [Ignavibacteriota bacterium]